MAPVEIRDLSKHFGDVAAVKNLSFDIEAGRVTGFWVQRRRKEHHPPRGLGQRLLLLTRVPFLEEGAACSAQRVIGAPLLPEPPKAA